MTPPLVRGGRRAGLIGVTALILGACSAGTTPTSAPTTGSALVGGPPEAPLTALPQAPSFTVLCAAPYPTTAPATVSVPVLVGIDVQDAVDHAACAGLRVQLQPPTARKFAIVIAQAPAAGAEVPVGTTVAITVHPI